jgi:hypothetical protein
MEETITINRAIIFKSPIHIYEKRLDAMWYIMNRPHLKAKWKQAILDAKRRMQ